MPAQMFYAVPEGEPSLRRAYEKWLEAYTPPGAADPDVHPRVDPAGLSVGIVGAGMAGLYAALVLKVNGASVRLFEADPARVGGRVYTHRFTADSDQYFEAGAMRLPDIAEQQPVFGLIDYLNGKLPPDRRIRTIPYVLYDDTGNLVFVNGRTGPDGKPMTVAYADAHPDALGFSEQATGGRRAQDLIDAVIGTFLKWLEEDFAKGFQKLMQYDDYSFRSYLAQVEGWSEARINYVETMTSQTNQFQQSFTELVIENMDFTRAEWKTIENGMDRLPNGLADIVGRDNITMNARVTKIAERPDGRVEVWREGESEPATFDKVLLAVPPAALRMIETPQWSPAKTHAVRAMHFEPLYKIGLRFKTRFWERVATPARGGQSITDLPSRWFVYPSYGIGDDGPGVLLLYAWMTDAVGWLPQSADDRARLALRDLQTVYGQEVDVHRQFLEAFEVSWTVRESTGDAMFFPGQFKNLFNVARQPEGSIYFAGEHLSVHHTWIVGALDSALLACQQMLGTPELAPIGAPERLMPAAGSFDYSGCLPTAGGADRRPKTVRSEDAAPTLVEHGGD